MGYTARKINKHFNTGSVFKRSVHSILQDAMERAKKKGLKVNKNIFTGGWTILLPVDGSFHAHSDAEMVAFVKGF